LKRFSSYTLGCKLNYTETSTLERSLVAAGFSLVPFKEQTDLVVINTCSVTENAERDARKIVRQALRRSPDAFVVVLGCYAQLRPQDIASIEGVDLVLGSEDKFDIVKYLEEGKTNGAPKIVVHDIETAHDFIPAYSGETSARTRGFLKIQDGCDYTCSYCTIPFARGGSRSQDVGSTMVTLRDMISSGYKEIVLSGVNVGDYGTGHDNSLLQLLKEITNTEGKFRVRISSIEPNLLSDDIISLVAESEKLCAHFHIPMQSGSDTVLKLMRRRYSKKDFTDRIEKVASSIEDCGIGIDVIVGFPGESDSCFRETYQLLNELPVSYLHVFTYSERPGTVASSLPDAVPHIERHERSKMLRILSAKKRRQFYESQLDKELEVLFETENKDDLSMGFSGNYIRVAVPFTERHQNKILRVKTMKLGSGMLVGEVLQNGSPDE
jgi:threonylcarbamoyladenosine tRNA methylthiotransferase MtaB